MYISINYNLLLYFYCSFKGVFIIIQPAFHSSIHSSFYLFIHLSIHLSICQSIYSSIRLSIYPFVILSIHPFVHLSIHLPIYPSICPSICPYMYSPKNFEFSCKSALITNSKKLKNINKSH